MYPIPFTVVKAIRGGMRPGRLPWGTGRPRRLEKTWLLTPRPHMVWQPVSSGYTLEVTA